MFVKWTSCLVFTSLISLNKHQWSSPKYHHITRYRRTDSETTVVLFPARLFDLRSCGASLNWQNILDSRSILSNANVSNVLPPSPSNTQSRNRTHSARQREAFTALHERTSQLLLMLRRRSNLRRLHPPPPSLTPPPPTSCRKEGRSLAGEKATREHSNHRKKKKNFVH